MEKYQDFLKELAKTLMVRIFDSKGVTATAKEVGVAITRLEEQIYEADWFHRGLADA